MAPPCPSEGRVDLHVAVASTVQLNCLLLAAPLSFSHLLLTLVSRVACIWSSKQVLWYSRGGA